MNRPRALAQPSPQGGAQAAVEPRSSDEARAQRQRPHAAPPALTAGSLPMTAAGARALAGALFGDGGVVALALGVALRWHPVRRLILAFRAVAATSSGPRDAVAAAVGKPKARRG